MEIEEKRIEREKREKIYSTFIREAVKCHDTLSGLASASQEKRTPLHYGYPEECDGYQQSHNDMAIYASPEAWSYAYAIAGEMSKAHTSAMTGEIVSSWDMNIEVQIFRNIMCEDLSLTLQQEECDRSNVSRTGRRS
ncbi:hypothetical protein GCM10009550_20010 [Actinocorallia libanotica]|uniref:Uncharacterized protein n=1 Tax=Actinocorallia libanotica TaxID=46162 RepID=A0ABP4B883_9ACTN